MFGQYLLLVSQKIKACELHISVNNAIKYSETIREWKAVKFWLFSII